MVLCHVVLHTTTIFRWVTFSGHIPSKSYDGTGQKYFTGCLVYVYKTLGKKNLCKIFFGLDGRAFWRPKLVVNCIFRVFSTLLIDIWQNNLKLPHKVLPTPTICWNSILKLSDADKQPLRMLEQVVNFTQKLFLNGIQTNFLVENVNFIASRWTFIHKNVLLANDLRMVRISICHDDAGTSLQLHHQACHGQISKLSSFHLSYGMTVNH